VRLEALRGSERRVVRIVGMVGLTLDETRIVSSRPDWPLRSLMPKGSLRVKRILEAADRSDRAKRRARIDAERAREQAEENAQRAREEAEEERLRVEEEARMRIEEREKALKLAIVEAEVWERESSCSSHRSFPTGSKRNREYVCFDRSRCDKTQLQPERRLSLYRNKCDVNFRRDRIRKGLFNILPK